VEEANQNILLPKRLPKQKRKRAAEKIARLDVGLGPKEATTYSRKAASRYAKRHEIICSLAYRRDAKSVR
jgi:hypothetical protein